MSIPELSMVFAPLASPNKDALVYPFSWIRMEDDGSGYLISDFSEGIIGEEKCECGDFPNNIIEFYWIHEGENDEDAWECLCKLDNGNYAFYTASCDYTGFDCQGGMRLIISKNAERLFYDGLIDEQRERCLIDKGIKEKVKKVWKPSAEWLNKMKSTTASAQK